MMTNANCPECGCKLQRLSGKDGHAVIEVFDRERLRGTVERRVIDAVYACTGCEFAIIGRQIASAAA